MKRRKIARLLLATLLVLIISGCSPDSDTSMQTAAPLPQVDVTSTVTRGVSLRITWALYSGRGEAIQKIVAAYNATRSTPVAMTGGDEDMKAIQALLDSGAPYLYVLPYRYVEYFGMKGALLDLTAAFETEKSSFYPEVWALGNVKGVTYGIPWLGHAMCLLYNQTLLAKAGVDAASIQSLASWVSAMKQVEARTDAKGFGLVGAEGNDVSWMVNQFIYGFGGSLVNREGTAVTINSKESRAALTFYKNILGAYAQPSWLQDTGVQVMDHFRDQQIAFEIQGIWGVTDIQKNGDPFEVGVISLKDIGLCAEVGPMMLAIPADLGEPMRSQALDLIRYLISPKAQEQILMGEYSPERDTYYPFRTPIRSDATAAEAFRAYPAYEKFIEGFKNPSVDVPVPAWQLVKDTYYSPGLHRYLAGEISADTLLTQIETEGNRLLQKQ